MQETRDFSFNGRLPHNAGDLAGLKENEWSFSRTIWERVVADWDPSCDRVLLISAALSGSAFVAFRQISGRSAGSLSPSQRLVIDHAEMAAFWAARPSPLQQQQEQQSIEPLEQRCLAVVSEFAHRIDPSAFAGTRSCLLLGNSLDQDESKRPWQKLIF